MRLFARTLLCVAACCLMVVALEGGAQTPPPMGPLEEALRVALQGEDKAKIRELLNAGANVNARDVLGGSALHVAANFRGDTEVMTLLLDKGAHINALNQDGATPLLLALRHGHYRHEGKGERIHKVAEFLLSRGASLKTAADGPSLIRAAMDPVNLLLIQLLIKHGAPLPDDGLDWALSNEYVDLVKLLMARVTPAMLAFKDPGGGGLLHRAAAKPGLRFAMAWLLGKGFDVNERDRDGVTPFGRAAFADNIPGMAFLADAKATIDTLSSDGLSALHFAAYGARHDVMGWLIACGLDIRARDKYGRTPLDIALQAHRYAFYDEARKLELIKLLGGVPADMARGRFGAHPLHVAVYKHDLATVQRLLESGVSPNLKDASGHTPLYWAILWSSHSLTTPSERAVAAKLLPLLLRHGADTTMLKGDSREETYDLFAKSLRIGDVLERAKQRYAPRR